MCNQCEPIAASYFGHYIDCWAHNRHGWMPAEMAVSFPLNFAPSRLGKRSTREYHLRCLVGLPTISGHRLLICLFWWQMERPGIQGNTFWRERAVNRKRVVNWTQKIWHKNLTSLHSLRPTALIAAILNRYALPGSKLTRRFFDKSGRLSEFMFGNMLLFQSS